MGIITYKPTSAGRRRSSVQSFSDITTSHPYRRLVLSQKEQAGRSWDGKITVRHRGGGVRRHIRVIDWKQEKFEIPGIVSTIEYDPNRGARIALVTYHDGVKRYVLAPQGMVVGTKIITSLKKGDPTPGSRFPLSLMPEGTPIFNIELQPGKGGQAVRGAGTSAMLLAIEGEYATIRMPSGETRMVLASCMATVGTVSNPDWRLVRWGKAGRTRMRSIRPTVRGKVMNPVDHPHGGGEGKTAAGRDPCSPWGQPAKGYRTRRNKRTDNMIVSRRHKR